MFLFGVISNKTDPIDSSWFGPKTTMRRFVQRFVPLLVLFNLCLAGYPPDLQITEEFCHGLSDVFFGLESLNQTEVGYDEGSGTNQDDVHSGSRDLYNFNQWRWVRREVTEPGDDLLNYAVRADGDDFYLLVDRLGGTLGRPVTVWLSGTDLVKRSDGKFNGLHKRGDFLVSIHAMLFPNRFGDTEYVHTHKWSSSMPYGDISTVHLIATNPGHLNVTGLPWFPGVNSYGPYELVYLWVDLSTLSVGSNWELKTVIIGTRTGRGYYFENSADLILHRFV